MFVRLLDFRNHPLPDTLPGSQYQSTVDIPALAIEIS